MRLSLEESEELAMPGLSRGRLLHTGKNTGPLISHLREDAMRTQPL